MAIKLGLQSLLTLITESTLSLEPSAQTTFPKICARARHVNHNVGCIVRRKVEIIAKVPQCKQKLDKNDKNNTASIITPLTTIEQCQNVSQCQSVKCVQ